MNQERAKQLEKFIEDDPKEPFFRYALALELAHDQQDRAVNLLCNLIKNTPGYVPSYYQAAILLLDQNRFEEAKIVIEKGIIIARNQGESKAVTELKALWEELE